MGKRFIADTLKVAQVPAHTLTSKAIEILSKQASFVDADDTLNEFMVSVDTIAETIKEVSEVKNELQALLAEVNQYQYIQVTSI